MVEDDFATERRARFVRVPNPKQEEQTQGGVYRDGCFLEVDPYHPYESVELWDITFCCLRPDVMMCPLCCGLGTL